MPAVTGIRWGCSPDRHWARGQRGLRNLLIVTGDPPVMGAPTPDATAVIRHRQYRAKRISCRGSITASTREATPWENRRNLVIGVGVNPAAWTRSGAAPLRLESGSGGRVCRLTQPVFDIDQLDRFLTRVESFRIPIIAGIWPLISQRNAEFLANEVPGISIPHAIPGADASGEPEWQGTGASGG